MKSQINVFIFRRDLRVQDNLALKQLLEKYPKIPTALIFILFNTGLPFLTIKTRDIEVDEKSPASACVAVIVVEPPPTIVTVFPDMVATAVLELE